MPDINSSQELEQPAKIVCVDDEPNILSALRRTFRREGHQVFVFHNGYEALEFLQQEPVDLVISDMRMPEMDGAELLKRIRQGWPKLATILLTGHSDLESTIKAVNLGGIACYFAKPWDDKELCQKVRDLLRLTFLERERDALRELTHEQNKKLIALNHSLEQRVQARTAELQQTADMLDTAFHDLSQSYELLVKVLSSLVCSRKELMGENSLKLAGLTQQLTVKVQSNEYDQKQTYFAALLFQIGKIGMSDVLLSKPIQQLDEAERKLYFQYPALGESALMCIPMLKDTRIIIKHHCEYLDGSGEPCGLKANEIPLGAQILALVKDYFYWQWKIFDGVEHTAPDARKYLLAEAGNKYDTLLVNEFIPIAKSFEQEQSIIAESLMDSKQLEPGMELSRDCTNNQGWLMLTRGTKLNSEQIEKLKGLENIQDKPLHVYIKQ